MKLAEDCKYCANFFCMHCFHCRRVTNKATDGDYCCKGKHIAQNYLAYVRAMEFINKLTDEEKQALANAFGIPKGLLFDKEEELNGKSN